jgi:hypothetical protein
MGIENVADVLGHSQISNEEHKANLQSSREYSGEDYGDLNEGHEDDL